MTTVEADTAQRGLVSCREIAKRRMSAAVGKLEPAVLTCLEIN